MPQFRYEVKKGPGESSTGVLDADSQRAAVSRLREMGYYPIKVEEFSGPAPAARKEKKEKKKAAAGKKTRSLNFNFSLPRGKRVRRIKLSDRNVFFRQMANLTESGMPITRALRTLAEQTENPALAVVIEQLRDDVQKGNSFADAMERHPKLFPAMYRSLVRAGETGGMLDEVFWRIVAFGEQEEELKGKAVSAMIYPAFLLTIGSLAVFILLSFVFPKFITIFNDFHAKLPLPTRIVMALCGFMGAWWWAVLIGILGAIAAFTSYARSVPGRRQLDLYVLRIPVIRGVVQKYEMAKFARTLGTLLDNGVPVLSAIRITSDTMSNMVLREEVAAVHDAVTEGESMSDSLQKAAHFPPLVVNMFAVGEESGRIGAVAKRVADAYDLEVDRAVKAMTALFEPLLIVVMGVVIGFLVIAMLLPMLTLSANIGA